MKGNSVERGIDEDVLSARGDLVLGTATVSVVLLLLLRVGTYSFHFEPLSRALCELAIGGLLLGWAILAVLRPALRPSTVLAGPVAIACVAFGFSVLASQRPRLSLEPALIGVASALTFLMATSLLRRTRVRRLVGTTFTLLAGLIAIAYLVQVGLEWTRFWTLLGRFDAPPLRPSFVALTFGSPNLVATFVLLVAPLAIVLSWQRFGVGAASGLLAASVTALILTGSRGGYLGLGLAIVVGAAIGVSSLRTWARERLGRFHRREVAVLVAALAGSLAVALILAPSLLARLTFGGSDLRLWYWRTAMELFLQHPLTGTGPGTWAQLKIAEALPDEINIVVTHAHSLLFQTLTEAGALGLIALLAFVIAVVWRCREVFVATDMRQRLQIVAVVMSLAALVGQQIPDYVMNLPSVAIVVAILIAWVDGMPLSSSAVPRGRMVRASVRLAQPSAVVLGAILVVSVPTVIRIDQAALIADEANWMASAGDWSGALVRYDDALSRDPEFAFYRIERASALAHLGRLTDARDTYAAVVGEDLLPENVLGLASVELELGNTSRATELATLGLGRGWRNPIVALNAGRIFEAAGENSDAVAAYGAALAADPALARSAFWHQSERRVTKIGVIGAARLRLLSNQDHGSAALLSAYAGQPSEARMEVAAIGDAGVRAWIGPVVEAIVGDRQGGLIALRGIVASRPSDFMAVAWLARLLADAGDPMASSYREEALILRADEASTTLELSVVPALQGDRGLGAWPYYPAAVYSRIGPVDLWPPQLLVIGTTEPS